MDEAVGARAITDFAQMKREGTKIVMVTAYDAPSARFADEAGVDLILVGDSAGNNVLGYPSTVPVTMDELMMLTAAVTRAVRHAVVVADLPFGSYQASDEEAVANAVRFVKDAGASAVKLEGAGPMLSRVRAMVGAGIPVMGHGGLTPQSATMLGGMKAQGRTAAKARRLFADAVDLQEAGCFAVVLEAVPARVASRISEVLRVPTIGIGAGPGCDGQVLVWHDLLGITEGHTPKFVRRFADVAGETRRGLESFVSAVRSGEYPAEEHTYAISDEELALFESDLGEHVRAE
jgi:3-methyl-2-oxobutanoate hydroxymethyltransferase